MRNFFSLLLLAGAVGFLAIAYAPAFLRAAPDVIVGQAGWLYPGWDRLVDERKTETRSGVRMVREVAAILEGRGERFVIVLVPTKARAVPEYLPERLAAAVSRANDYAELVDELRSAGIEVVDTLPLLRKRHLADQQAYFRRDAHWTGYSAEAAAGALAARLQARGWVADTPPDGERLLGWERARRYPDLVAILRRQGDLSLGEEMFTQRQYVPPPKGRAGILVLGSSFADRRYGLPQTLSQLLDRKVVNISRFGAEGSWQAMVEHLRGPDEAQPDVVVWQLSEGAFSSREAQTMMAAYLKEKGRLP